MEPFTHRNRTTAVYVDYLLHQPLRARDRETGSLYLFTTGELPGHVKIGTTTYRFKDRARKIAAKCGYQPTLIKIVNNIPHARRAEQLIFRELAQYRRKDNSCGCGSIHYEWFEINIEHARKVVMNWSAWFKRTRPYNKNGGLRPEIQGLVCDLIPFYGAISARILLDESKDVRRAEKGRKTIRPLLPHS